MKLIRIFTLLSLFLSLVCRGQNYELFEGEKINKYQMQKETLGNQPNKPLGKIGEHTFLFRHKTNSGAKGHMIILKTSNAKIIQMAEIKNPLNTEGEKLNTETAFILNNKIIIICSDAHNKFGGGGTIDQYAFTFDPIKMELEGVAKFLHTIIYNQPIKKKSEKFIKEALYSDKDFEQYYAHKKNIIIHSPDKRKVAILRTNDANEKGVYPNQATMPDIFFIDVFDSSMNTIWRCDTLALFTNSSYFDVTHFKLNDEGDLFLSGVEYDSRNLFDIEGFHLISFRENGSRSIDQKIKLEGKKINGLNFTFDENNDILVSGIYSEEKLNSPSGVFIKKIGYSDSTMNYEKLHQVEFNFINYSASIQDRTKETSLTEVDFMMKDIFLDSNGSVFMVSERIRNPGDHLYYGALPMMPRHLYFEDIIVSKFSSDGTLLWNTKIDKVQKCYDPNIGSDLTIYSSYVLGFTNETVYISYSETKYNLNCTSPKEYYETKWDMGVVGGEREFFTLLKSIDKDGKIATDKITVTKDKTDVLLIPKFSSFEGNQMILHNTFMNAHFEDSFQIRVLKLK